MGFRVEGLKVLNALKHRSLNTVPEVLCPRRATIKSYSKVLTFLISAFAINALLLHLALNTQKNDRRSILIPIPFHVFFCEPAILKPNIHV